MIRGIVAMVVATNILIVSAIVMTLEWLLLKARPRTRFVFSMAIIAFLVSMLMIDNTMSLIIWLLER